MIFIFVFLSILAILIPLLNLRLSIKAIAKNRHNHFSLRLGLFKGLINFELNFALALLKEGVVSFLFGRKNLDTERLYSTQDIYDFLLGQIKNYDKYKIDIKKIGSKINLDRIWLDIKVGLDDAALTALFYGITQNVFTGLDIFLNKNSQSTDVEFNILPDFMGKKLEIEFDCIINIRLGHIISIGMRMFVQNIKGGDIIGRTPHREHNDYHYGKH